MHKKEALQSSLFISVVILAITISIGLASTEQTANPYRSAQETTLRFSCLMMDVGNNTNQATLGDSQTEIEGFLTIRIDGNIPTLEKLELTADDVVIAGLDAGQVSIQLDPAIEQVGEAFVDDAQGNTFIEFDSFGAIFTFSETANFPDPAKATLELRSGTLQQHPTDENLRVLFGTLRGSISEGLPNSGFALFIFPFACAETLDLSVPNIFPTIQAAIDAAPAGSTIEVDSSTYDSANERFPIEVDKEGIFLQSVNGRALVINNDTEIDTIQLKRDDTGIDGFEIRGGDSAIVLGDIEDFVSIPIQNVTIRNNLLRDGEFAGIYGEETSAVIENNRISGFLVGISFFRSGEGDVTIRENLFLDNRTGINLFRTNGEITRNILLNHDANGIALNSAPMTLKDNVINGSSESGIVLDGNEYALSLIGNIIFGNERKGIIPVMSGIDVSFGGDNAIWRNHTGDFNLLAPTSKEQSLRYSLLLQSNVVDEFERQLIDLEAQEFEQVSISTTLEAMRSRLLEIEAESPMNPDLFSSESAIANSVFVNEENEVVTGLRIELNNSATIEESGVFELISENIAADEHLLGNGELTGGEELLVILRSANPLDRIIVERWAWRSNDSELHEHVNFLGLFPEMTDLRAFLEFDVGIDILQSIAFRPESQPITAEEISTLENSLTRVQQLESDIGNAGELDSAGQFLLGEIDDFIDLMSEFLGEFGSQKSAKSISQTDRPISEAALEVKFVGVLPLIAALKRAMTSFDDSIPSASRIRGFVYEDINGNGLRDEGEEGLSGWSLSLSGVQDTQTQLTNSSGVAEFSTSSLEAFVLSPSIQTGWTPTTLIDIENIFQLVPSALYGKPSQIEFGMQFPTVRVGIGSVPGLDIDYSIPCQCNCNAQIKGPADGVVHAGQIVTFLTDAQKRCSDWPFEEFDAFGTAAVRTSEAQWGVDSERVIVTTEGTTASVEAPKASEFEEDFEVTLTVEFECNAACTKGETRGEDLLANDVNFSCEASITFRVSRNCADIRAEWERLNKLVPAKEGELAEARARLAELEAKLVELERAAQQLEARRQLLEDEIMRVEAELDALEDMINEIEQNLNDLEQSKTEIQDETEALEKEISKFDDSLENIDRAKAKLKLKRTVLEFLDQQKRKISPGKRNRCANWSREDQFAFVKIVSPHWSDVPEIKKVTDPFLYAACEQAFTRTQLPIVLAIADLLSNFGTLLGFIGSGTLPQLTQGYILFVLGMEIQAWVESLDPSGDLERADEAFNNLPLDEKIAKLDELISSLRMGRAKKQAELSERVADLARIDREIFSTRVELGTLQAKRARLQSRLEALREDLNDDAIDKALEALQNEIEEQEMLIGELEGELEDINEDKDRLNRELKDCPGGSPE